MHMISDKLTVIDESVDANTVESVHTACHERAQVARQSFGSTMNVYVHLAMDKDAVQWRKKRESGDLVGINDPTPYGYGRAQAMGCHVVFSNSARENKLEKLFRLGLRVLLGADVVHAWRNRAAIGEADIVWTHTESQYLAVAMVGVLLRKRIPMIGQTVWLMDSWDSLTSPKKMLIRWLVSRIDVLTFHSPENYARAKILFPGVNARLVKFGIPAEKKRAPVERPASAVVNILALGNDRHRDWKTLIEAVNGVPNFRLKILSGSVPRRIAKHGGNVEVTRARSNDELHRAFEEATVVCVPLKDNLHASGLTVIQEAILAGVPVVATNIGGLSTYFSADEIRYVPIGDATALRAAFDEIAREPARARARAARAQALMADPDDLGAQAYIRDHVTLSREILGR